MSLLIVDVDRFSSTNQHYGYREGDQYLRSLGTLLQLNIRDHDLLCRYAGDRFVIMLPVTGSTLAALLAQQLSSACQYFSYKTTSGETINHTISIGIVTARHETAEHLMMRAHHALLKAKENPAPVAVRVVTGALV
ncbi:GGDEF domain-containing protein [Endozoicomonas ascidiicola]|uniref:GGDEF domain-containing protein n=1 Tax=Endozoicomonas ascidiicola TaxID=1698521 RepID=UPI0008332D7A|nr:GGDEF domain-containing protein [Endozoicomonas ascidiicola]